ncbi:MAG: hypothetical protein GXD23_19795 [Comamonadaceae bacterium]|jgi:hypothetical protein|uniref:hypothetical protein n=1 Tax=Hydrogenophaga TaxID=47420 RepID=UPI0011C18C3B|nr:MULTISPECIES: hypothetical protein [Hydrogenophaga]NCT99618.1 hypothetical protein [Comamonadaceae bacterium]WQB85562.1 hypothetical protein SOM08_09620 [Hydrogenophaga sp. SNF1]
MKQQHGSRSCVVIALLAGALGTGRAEPPHHPAPVFAAEPVRAFLSNPDFCAYMLSPPDGESASFLVRFDDAAQAAVRGLRAADAALTETGALFRLRAGCDARQAAASD